MRGVDVNVCLERVDAIAVMVFKLFRLSDIHQRLKETALKATAHRVKQLTRQRLNIAITLVTSKEHR